MRRISKIGTTAMFLLALAQSNAQQQPMIVNLTVIDNGKVTPAPSEILLSFNDHSLRIQVVNGSFGVPAEIVEAKTIVLETDVADSHIRLTKLTGRDFRVGKWTLRLADEANDKYYEWPGPKNARIPSTCIVEFDNGQTCAARAMFEEHCRTRMK
ncbi:MAG: hypothetical protein AB1714_07540 [Acidobacteriota bacterium]